MAITPFKHQMATLQRSKHQRRLGVWADIGVGKTIMLLLVSAERPMPTVVLAPPHVVYDAWLSDGEHFRGQLELFCYHDTPAKRAKVLEAAAAAGDRAVLVTTHETFRIDVKKIRERFRPRRLIIDESDKVKGRKSKVTRAVHEVCDGDADEVYLLSGEPEVQDASDWWAQLRCLDGSTGGWADAPDAKFGRPSFHRWAAYWLNELRRHVFEKAQPVVSGYRLREDRRQAFNAMIAQAWIRIKKSECLDLPDTLVQPLYVDLSREQRRLYEELLDGGEAWLGGEEQSEDPDIVARNITMKLRQVVGGHVKDAANKWQELPSAKLDRLAELVGGFGHEPFIVWTQFRPESTRVAQFLRDLTGEPVGEAHGGVTQSAAREHIKRFKAGEQRILVCHPASVGHGITLVKSGDRPCSIAVYYSIGPAWGQHHQSMGRIHRVGQVQKCTYYYLLARQTRDLQIRQALDNKRDATRMICDGVRDEMARRRALRGAA